MRSLAPLIEKDLGKKMVFLSGPRQVGKTHLAQEICKKSGGRYYNWDLAEDRQGILTKSFIEDRVVILDELHKYDRWKGFLKGVYDKYHDRLQMLVTGSARMDLYRRGGDSLLGRYYLHHLHPLTMGECDHPSRIPSLEEALRSAPSPGRPDLLKDLLAFGGFPEPFYAGDAEQHRRWSLQRLELLVREDIRDLTNINLLSLIEHLALLLPARVGSILSLNSLKEDLRVAYNTVVSWIETFERLYLVFLLQPFTTKLGRAVHKEKKLYLWDWSQVKEEGARFENLIASHLWKAVQCWRDLGKGDFGLFFLRDRDRREVDFCVTEDGRPRLLVEAKFGDTTPSETLDYFAAKINVPAIQVVAKAGWDRPLGRVRLVSADRWLLGLP